MKLETVEQARSYDCVFISPHFDDVALSCGGVALLGREAKSRILCLSVFVGGVQDGSALTDFAKLQHRHWGRSDNPEELRRGEELAAMSLLEADYLWLDHPDAIYRNGQYRSDAELFATVKPDDHPLLETLQAELSMIWQGSPDAAFYAPLGVGGHVDHQLCHVAAIWLARNGATVAYYEDIPYALQPYALNRRLREVSIALRPSVIELGPLINDKLRLIECYQSQLDWIFRDYGPAARVLQSYAAATSKKVGGFAERIWASNDR